MNSENNKFHSQRLYAHRIGIDTYKQAAVFIRCDSEICRSEGFETTARIHVALGNHFIIATLYTVSEELLPRNKIGLSEYAWQLLSAKEGDVVRLSHPAPLNSLSHMRAKVYGHELEMQQMQSIIQDIAKDRYSDVELSAFITACAGDRLSDAEIFSLTQAMVNAGNKLTWPAEQVVDKHCIGGLPGNRTTLIVVPIVAAFGLTIPKTSSRAITSPAGTADTMEVLAPVALSLAQMRKVVEKENGCVVWGGSSDLSPADDVLIRVERVLNLDNEGQMVASVLSKKIAAGSSHVIIDIPIGPTVKMRDLATAQQVKRQFENVSKQVGMKIEVLFTDGTKPVGRGLGPVLEARDVLAVLQNQKNAPDDLRKRALTLAGKVLEFSPKVKRGTGLKLATELLTSGKAWHKFQAICEAQGGFSEPKLAAHKHIITATSQGTVAQIDNRRLATIAKLAGAPRAKAAGIELHANVGTKVEVDQPLFTIHAEAPGELDYAVSAIRSEHDIMRVERGEGSI
ncbi:MAG: thymidine phosphorylase family protein [Gammaproteobacteria bacterium]|nr:thymidine phosphorylase family protein [Gammaproteobacteria bacterium]